MGINNVDHLNHDLPLGKLYLKGLAGVEAVGLGYQLSGLVLHQGIAATNDGIGVEGHQVGAEGLTAFCGAAQFYLYSLGEAAFELIESVLLLFDAVIETQPLQSLSQILKIVLGEGNGGGH